MGFDTLKRLMEERDNLLRILDNLQEGIIAHDQNRRIVFFNKSAEKITGFKREEVLNKDCHDVFGRPFCGDQCSFLVKDPSFTTEINYSVTAITKHGDLKKLEMVVNPIFDKEGKFFGVLACFKDVTDLLTLEFQFRKISSFNGIIGNSPQMLQIYQKIKALAQVDYPVHIYGETGSGKELVAHAIHHESKRAKEPFVPVNCSALPENLLESELFGYEKGAFTGAYKARKGRFELAHKGTLFLDEIGDMPFHLQAKLLRAIETGYIEKLGGESPVKIDVRIISATHKDLAKEVKEGRFRSDLYYRLNVVPIHIPPLRERAEDIPLLVEHFLKEAQKEGMRAKATTKQALKLLMEYQWPGNVRELQSAIRYALIHSQDGLIKEQDLPHVIREKTIGSHEGTKATKITPEDVKEALLRTKGSKTRAAQLLGIGRATLYRYLKKN